MWVPGKSFLYMSIHTASMVGFAPFLDLFLGSLSMSGVRPFDVDRGKVRTSHMIFFRVPDRQMSIQGRFRFKNVSTSGTYKGEGMFSVYVFFQFC